MPSISRIQKSGDRPRTSRVYSTSSRTTLTGPDVDAGLLTPTMTLPQWTRSRRLDSWPRRLRNSRGAKRVLASPAARRAELISVMSGGGASAGGDRQLSTQRTVTAIGRHERSLGRERNDGETQPPVAPAGERAPPDVADGKDERDGYRSVSEPKGAC